VGIRFLTIRKRSRHAWSELLPVMAWQISITETTATTRGPTCSLPPVPDQAGKTG
jgi:hypothetical protein